MGAPTNMGSDNLGMWRHDGDHTYLLHPFAVESYSASFCKLAAPTVSQVVQ